MTEPEIHSYPLAWPDGWKRTPAAGRKVAHFNRKEEVFSGAFSRRRQQSLSVADGLNRLLIQLEMMGVKRDNVIVSTNVPARLDGMPRSDQRRPQDPGAAVYWKTNSAKPMRCMAIDIYSELADNLAALAATLDAMRSIERHGGAQIIERAFRGFTALPEVASSPWRDVLQYPVNLPPEAELVQARFREMVKLHHPDVGGDSAKFQQIVAARDAAIAEQSRLSRSPNAKDT